LPSCVIWDLYVAHSVGEVKEYFVKVAIIELLKLCNQYRKAVWGISPFVR
jgi:hypothetical protein